MGDPPRGGPMDLETVNLLWVLYNACAYQPCKNESLTFTNRSHT